mmetsp:Transcript_35855/g.143289  ORF Transcript_35855/g.143289 Transcript_35855/m.143289 type:complete len:280 (-) Transcript_35855:392-1231(-)
MTFLKDGDDNSLLGSNSGRDNQTPVVGVDHYHNSDSSRRQTPRVLPYVLCLSFIILILDIKHLSKILSKAVTCGSLNRSTSCRDKAFDGRSIQRTRELLAFCFRTANDRHGEEILVDGFVYVQDIEHLCGGLFTCRERGVPFLPKEFSRANKGGAMSHLPSYNVAPLVNFKRQIPERAYPLRECRVHDGLRGGTNRYWLIEFLFPRFRHPCNLRFETFDVILLLLQSIGAHEQGKIAVLHPEGFDSLVQHILDGIPYRKASWAKYIASLKQSSTERFEA